MCTLQVYKGRRKCTGQITAIKFIMKHGKSEKDIRSLRQEIEILRTLRHENIIQMLDSFETKTDFCVVTGTGEGRERCLAWHCELIHWSVLAALKRPKCRTLHPARRVWPRRIV